MNEELEKIAQDMRKKERELWAGNPPRMGNGAVALMLDGYASRLEVALGLAPRPKCEAAAAAKHEMAKEMSKKMDENRAITGNTAALRLCDELIQAAYDADICSPYDLAQRVRKIKDAIGPSPQPGNAAALRAALIQCELFLGNVSRHAHPTLNPGDKCIACDGVDELRGMVEAALSAPPRNCDVGDVNEQMQRFESYCNAHEPCESCPLVRPRTTPSCGVHWSQLTYEKEGGSQWTIARR